MYSREVVVNKEFECEHIIFTIDDKEYNTETIEDILVFIHDSQEEIETKNDYTFNKFSIVGCDLIDHMRRF